MHAVSMLLATCFNSRVLSFSSPQLFCQDRRADLKKDNPKAGSPEIDALLKTEWAALSDEDKAPYLAKREQLKEEAVQLAAEFAAQQAANSDCDGNDAPAAPAKGKKRANAGAKPQGGAKKAKKAQGGDDEDAETAPMKTTARSAAAVAAAAEEDEDEDREVRSCDYYPERH